MKYLVVALLLVLALFPAAVGNVIDAWQQAQAAGSEPAIGVQPVYATQPPAEIIIIMATPETPPTAPAEPTATRSVRIQPDEITAGGCTTTQTAIGEVTACVHKAGD